MCTITTIYLRDLKDNYISEIFLFHEIVWCKKYLGEKLIIKKEKVP